jgi:hypothetical protein
MSQAPAANFPPSVVTTSAPPAVAGLTNAPTLVEPATVEPGVIVPTMTVPRPVPVEIPQAFVPASTAPGLPVTTENIPHTTAGMPRVVPPQVLAPTVREMTLVPVGRVVPPSALTISSGPPASGPISGVGTNPDGSLIVPMTYQTTNVLQSGGSGAWDNQSPEINGVKYHW